MAAVLSVSSQEFANVGSVPNQSTIHMWHKQEKSICFGNEDSVGHRSIKSPA